jgi:hypothetical protein
MMDMNAPTAVLRRRIPTAVGALLAIGLLASACGSTATDDGPEVAALPPENGESAAPADDADGDTSVDPEEVSEEDAEAAMFRYDQCMIDNGVDVDELFGDVEDGGTVTIEADDDFDAQYAAYEAANEECESILEEVFGDFSLSPEQEVEFADAEAKFNQCMTDSGFPISSSGEGEAAGFEVDAEADFEELEAAMDECNKVFEDSGLFGDSEVEVGE